MQVQRSSSISFGYNHPLKTLYKEGKLPFLKKGCYGEELRPENCTIEHFKLHSRGGKTSWDNIGLTSANKNMERGSKTLSSFIDWKAIGEYLSQFQGQEIPGFGKGEDYIKGIIKTISALIQRGE